MTWEACLVGLAAHEDGRVFVGVKRHRDVTGRARSGHRRHTLSAVHVAHHGWGAKHIGVATVAVAQAGHTPRVGTVTEQIQCRARIGLGHAFARGLVARDAACTKIVGATVGVLYAEKALLQGADAVGVGASGTGYSGGIRTPSMHHIAHLVRAMTPVGGGTVAVAAAVGAVHGTATEDQRDARHKNNEGPHREQRREWDFFVGTPSHLYF